MALEMEPDLSGPVLTAAGRADVRALAVLWSRAFPDRRTPDDRERQLRAGAGYGGLEDSWVVKRRGRLLAACRLHSLHEYLTGVAVPMMGLAAVAVAPEARRKGLGAALCRNAIRIARERGDVVSVLYPFRPGFYRRLGWGYVGRLHAHRFAPAQLVVDRDAAAAVRPAESADRHALQSCYARVARASHGPIARSENVWHQHLGGHAYAAVVERKGSDSVGGYVIVVPGRQRVNADRRLRIRELVAEDRDAYHSLLAWIAAQRDQWPQATYEARPDEHFERWLDDPRPPRFPKPSRPLWDPIATILRGPMLRVLDVPAALQARRWAPTAGTLRLRIEVRDAELPENLGPWLADVHDERAALVQGPCNTADAAFTADASTFARIWTGEIRASEAAVAGHAEVDDPDRLLDTALAVPHAFWLPDEF